LACTTWERQTNKETKGWVVGRLLTKSCMGIPWLWGAQCLWMWHQLQLSLKPVSLKTPQGYDAASLSGHLECTKQHGIWVLSQDQVKYMGMWHAGQFNLHFPRCLLAPISHCSRVNTW
jgi:hypothetical protein